MRRRVRRNLLLGIGAALAAAVLALGRDEDHVAARIGERDLAAPSATASTLPDPAPAPEAAPARPAVALAKPAAFAPPPAPLPDGSPTVDLARMELHGDRYLAPMSDGRTAVLTIDPRIQEVAEKVLRRARAPRGAIVVTHPDGRILALAGRRTEDPAGQGEGIADPSLALDAWAPSASIFKIVSATALVESGAHKSDKVCFHGGLRSVMESNLTDSRQDRRCEDLAYGVAHSQNAIIAKLVHQRLSPAALDDTARRFGFEAALSSGPGAASLPVRADFGHLSLPPDKGVEFAKTAAGFTNVELSCLGGALLANTVGTGGIAVQPRLVAGYLEHGAEIPAPAPRPGQRVIEESVADEVGAMMTQTCASGSAAKAFAGRERIPDASGGGMAVAGKTGTLSVNEPFYLQYSWFVGYAPADKPQLSVSVLLGNPELWQLKAHTAARMVLIEALKARAGS